MLFKRFAVITTAAVLVWAAMPVAWALDVTPMVARLTPSGPGSTYRMTVRNTNDTPITVELQPYAMDIDENGVRTLTDELEDLVAFPPQSVIPPNREQIVQVRYVGDPQIAEPRLYLLRAAQLPIQMAADNTEPVQASVMMAFNINTHVYVSPPGAKPDLAVVSTRRAENGDILIVLQNSGDGIAGLRQARYRVTGANGQAVDVSPEKVVLGQVGTMNAGTTRNIRILAADAQGVDGEVSISVELL